MGVKETVQQVATAGAGVALAAGSLHGCGPDIIGDPAPSPPPLVCGDVGAGQSLSASATRDGATLGVRIHSASGDWRSWEVVEASGASLVSIASLGGGELAITLTLASAETRSGSFNFHGTLRDTYGTACDVRRTFTFTIGDGVKIAALDAQSMPLASRHSATIALLGRDGLEVELEARSSFEGGRQCTWFVSGGELETRAGSRVLWKLPEQPGLYQAQLVLDFGPAGMAFDALNLEVG